MPSLLAGAKSLDNKLLQQAERDKEHTAKEVRCTCGIILSPGDQACPSCGKVRRRRTRTVTLPGDLKEVDRINGKTKKFGGDWWGRDTG